jgi:hypothetical protein
VSEDVAGWSKGEGPGLWNAEVGCQAVRARKLFGRSPRERVLKEEISDVVRGEVLRLGLVGKK